MTKATMGWALVGALLAGGVAGAQEHGAGPGQAESAAERRMESHEGGAVAEHGAAAAAGGHGAGDESVADYILHHVSDSNEVEFQVPLTHTEFKLHFPVWRVPLKAGGCPADVSAPAPFPACLDLSITKATFFMWVAAALLILAMLLGTNRNKNQLVARGASQNIFEMLVLFVRDELAIKNIGKEHGPRYVPYLLTCFFFILFMNWLGLVPFMSTATGALGVTAGLALIAFVVTQYAGIKTAGLKTYLAHLTGGVHPALWPIMVPVEFLGLFTKPFALTVRLFANMLAGHIVIFFLLGLIFILRNAGVAIISVPFAFGIYLLEIFVGLVQAYVFTMLTALFIGMNVAMAHHHDDHSHDGHLAHGHDDVGHGHKEGGASHDHGRAHHV